jgi:antitoxin component YwqK of YwqJK toxin-antitoxin module
MRWCLLIGAAVVIILAGEAANADATVVRGNAPLEEYLDRPFDKGDICAVDSGLTAEDYHMIGGVRTLVQTDTTYKDNGSLEKTDKAIVDFAPDGKILHVQNFMDGDPFSETRYKYNAQGQIAQTQWSFSNSGPPCAFVYDPKGKLVSIAMIRGGDSSVIAISYLPDGRLKEAVKRKSATNEGIWRLAYSYAGSTVTIERFAKEGGKQTKEKALFELFADGHPKKITYDSTLRRGILVYARLPKGLMLVRDDFVGTDGGDNCTTSYWIHRNGDIDQQTMRMSGSQSEYCHNYSYDVSQVYFDKHGNNVVKRYGHRVDELGRKVTRWSEVSVRAITYYDAH